jgi:hypothetical protein
MLEAYTKHAQCFIDHYSNVTDPATNLTLDGKKSLGENMSDNGGFKLAYKIMNLCCFFHCKHCQLSKCNCNVQNLLGIWLA